jgi:hypothetical protein
LAAVVLQVGFSTRVVLARYRDNKKTTEMSDYALQRLNMVESQVRPSDVVDRRVIRAMLALPREEFVPQFIRSVCYTTAICHWRRRMRTARSASSFSPASRQN